jgi:hypothetical protein
MRERGRRPPPWIEEFTVEIAQPATLVLPVHDDRVCTARWLRHIRLAWHIFVQETSKRK